MQHASIGYCRKRGSPAFVLLTSLWEHLDTHTHTHTHTPAWLSCITVGVSSYSGLVSTEGSAQQGPSEGRLVYCDSLRLPANGGPGPDSAGTNASRTRGGMQRKGGGGKGAHRGWCKVEGRGGGGERWVDAWCLCDRRCVVSESIHSGTCSSLPFTNSNPVKDEFPAPNELSFLLDDRNQQAFPEPQELYPPQSAGEQGREGGCRARARSSDVPTRG